MGSMSECMTWSVSRPFRNECVSERQSFSAELWLDVKVQEAAVQSPRQSQPTARRTLTCSFRF